MDNEAMARMYPDVMVFVQQYYAIYDSNPVQLGAYYKELSMFSLDGQMAQGRNDIAGVLRGLKNTRHDIKHVDIMPMVPSIGSDMILVLVVGTIHIPTRPPARFSQVFHLNRLTPSGGSGFYVLTDICRLST